MAERLFTTYQVANLFRTTPGAVMDWIKEGALDYQTIGRNEVRVSESALIEFLRDKGIDLGDLLEQAVPEDQRQQIRQQVQQKRQPASSPPEPQVPEDPADKSIVDIAQELVQETLESSIFDAEPIELPPVDDVADSKCADAPEEQPVSSDEVEELLSSKPRNKPEPDEPQPLEQEQEPQQAPEAEAETAASQVMDAILQDASRNHAQTIHLTPGSEGLSLQLRVNGSLLDKPNFARRLPSHLRTELPAYLLEQAGCDAEKTTQPQSGRFTHTIGQNSVSVRLACLPTIHGPRIVLHLDPAIAAESRPVMLGLSESDERRIADILTGGWGMIIVAGSRRSGRDQVLQSLLTKAATQGRSVATFDKEVGLEIDQAAHALVDPAEGLSYAAAMEAISRQDADVILAGELRDPATARAALETAHDGALVLAGVNALSASDALEELLEMGLEPWPLSKTLCAIIESAPVRRLCEHCKKPVQPTVEQLESLGVEQDRQVQFFGPHGCGKCGGGYAHTLSVAAVTYMEGPLSLALRNGERNSQLHSASQETNGVSLRQHALNMAIQGIASLEDVACIQRSN